MKIIEETNSKRVQITLEYQHEVDQLYALLNFGPVARVLEEGTGEWKRLQSYLRDRQVNSNHWHTRFCQMELVGQ